MGQTVTTYDADQVLITFGGIVIDSGYADGTFVKEEKDATAFTYKVGTDGSVTRSKTKNKVRKVTITLMQSSYINDLLSQMLITDLAAPNGAGIAPFMLKDQNGTSQTSAPHAWIEAPPDAEWGREANEREWTFVLADASVVVGSNPSK